MIYEFGPQLPIDGKTAGRSRGPCSRSSRICPESSNPELATPACCIRANVEVLGNVITWFNRIGVKEWWIDYGTNLGFCVNGGFYWNDKDTDIGVMVSERPKILEALYELEQLGHKARYIEPRPGQYDFGDRVAVTLSDRNWASCDFAFWHKRRDGMLDRVNWSPWDRFKGREMPADWVLPVRQAMWEGIEVNIPAEPEKLAEHRYGAEWRNLPHARTDHVAR